MPKPKAQKLLERSTRLARDAVRLDNSGDFRGALAAYFLCVDTLADFNKVSEDRLPQRRQYMRTMASYLTRARLILDALKADKSAEPLADTVVEAAERWLSPHDVDAVPAPLSNAMDQADAARCGFAAAGEKSLALLSRGVHMVNASIEADRLGQPMVQVAYDGYKTGMEHLTSFYREAPEKLQSMKQRLLPRIRDFLERAEALKGRLPPPEEEDEGDAGADGDDGDDGDGQDSSGRGGAGGSDGGGGGGGGRRPSAGPQRARDAYEHSSSDAASRIDRAPSEAAAPSADGSDGAADATTRDVDDAVRSDGGVGDDGARESAAATLQPVRPADEAEGAEDGGGDDDVGVDSSGTDAADAAAAFAARLAALQGPSLSAAGPESAAPPPPPTLPAAETGAEDTPANEMLSKGCSHAVEAIAADNARDYPTAFDLYRRAVSLLNNFVSVAPPTLDGLVETLKPRIKDYAKRAEELRISTDGLDPAPVTEVHEDVVDFIGAATSADSLGDASPLELARSQSETADPAAASAALADLLAVGTPPADLPGTTLPELPSLPDPVAADGDAESVEEEAMLA